MEKLNGGGSKMDLDRLRLLNQDLLQRLKANQEEFKKRIQGQLASPSSPCCERKTPGRREIADTKGKETQDRFPKDVTNILRTVAAGERLKMEEPDPDSSSKPSSSRSGWQRERWPQEHLDPGSPSAKVILVSSAEASGSCQETGPVAENGNLQKDLRKPPVPSEEPSAGEKPDETRAPQNAKPRASVQMPQAPKSILLTPQCKDSKEKLKKEAGHVTFMSDPEEYTIPADSWSTRPLLGYDWIAGLLEMDSSVAEKPDQYFSELQEFRRVNRDACIYERGSWLDGVASPAHDRESDADPTSHQCVYCYRLNKRLFPEPLDPESACPVCKTSRAQRPPETLVEPAFVRVSIPRSTLLPAYKHKIHRRKSYEPADDLALPSHCLAGWENPIHAFSPTLSSLDLHSSLNAKPTGRSKQNSRVSGGTRTDELLDLSRVAEFELSNVARHWNRHKPPSCKATSH